MTGHGDNLKKLADLAERIIHLAEVGAYAAVEESSLLTYGVIRDAAYQIKCAVDKECRLQEGRPSSGDVLDQV